MGRVGWGGAIGRSLPGEQRASLHVRQATLLARQCAATCCVNSLGQQQMGCAGPADGMCGASRWAVCPPALSMPQPQLTLTSCVQLDASGMRASTSPMVLQVALNAGSTSWLAEAGPEVGGSWRTVGRPLSGENTTGAGVMEGPTPAGRGGRVSTISGAAGAGGGRVKAGEVAAGAPTGGTTASGAGGAAARGWGETSG